MSEYYIRTPDRDESRGPFTPSQLLTLAEADQITENTLYYDEPKEEWIPIGLNPALKEEVFPEREKLQLKINKAEEAEEDSKKKKAPAKEKAKNTVANMLAAAKQETKSARSQRKREKSFEFSTYLTNNGLSLVMLLSAATLIAPHFATIKEIASDKEFQLIFSYPLILLGIFDFIFAIFVYFGARELHSMLRGRMMLTLGFGAYVGWALGSLPVVLASVSAGLGTLLSTLSKRFSISIFTVALAFGGSAFLAYLSLTGYFNGLLENVYFEITFLSDR